MHKLLLISILVADVVIPIVASRRPGGQQALKKALVGVLLFNVVWLAIGLLTWR